MLRYLPGLILVQLVTITLFWVNRSGTLEELMLRAALPAALIAGVTALWFSALSRMQAQQEITRLTERHAKERETLNRTIERTRSNAQQQVSADTAKIVEKASQEREKLVRKTHQELLKQERSASRRANVKVGFAFMGMTALGVFMLITELLTLGLLTITTAGGAMGGYLFRWRQTSKAASLTELGWDNSSKGIPSYDDSNSDNDKVPGNWKNSAIKRLPTIRRLPEPEDEKNVIDVSANPRIVDADDQTGAG